MIILKKLVGRQNRQRVLFERLTEPLHLNLLSVVVALCGSFRQKVAWDLVLRHYHAFALLKSADRAKQYGVSACTVIEFGVAAGGGLMNLSILAGKVSSITGVDIQVYGFDSGKGMPPHRDYRDHPEFYREGDFPGDFSALQAALPPNGHLVLGDLALTVPQFVKERLTEEAPLGYIAVDVDYYSSTVDALKIFDGPPQSYLPLICIYLDDIEFEGHSPFAGELLAVNEFNDQHEFRKICRYEFLEYSRVFRNAAWLKHMFTLHVMDHPIRQVAHNLPTQRLGNPYL